jgi:hypothetical protein
MNPLNKQQVLNSLNDYIAWQLEKNNEEMARRIKMHNDSQMKRLTVRLGIRKPDLIETHDEYFDIYCDWYSQHSVRLMHKDAAERLMDYVLATEGDTVMITEEQFQYVGVFWEGRQ